APVPPVRSTREAILAIAAYSRHDEEGVLEPHHHPDCRVRKRTRFKRAELNGAGARLAVELDHVSLRGDLPRSTPQAGWDPDLPIDADEEPQPVLIGKGLQPVKTLDEVLLGGSRLKPRRVPPIHGHESQCQDWRHYAASNYRRRIH